MTITDYDANDTALAKVRAGGHGFDIVVPSANYVPIWIKEGLLLEARPDQMENFKNVDERWVNVPWDPGRHYTVPWQWGVSGIGVNSKVYGGDINTSAIWLDPPAGTRRQDQCRAGNERRAVCHDPLLRRRVVHRRQGAVEEGARQAGRGQAEMAGHGLQRHREAAGRRLCRRLLLERRHFAVAACQSRTSSSAIQRKAIRSSWTAWRS